MNSFFEGRVRACIVPMAISLSLLGACNEVTGVDLSWSLERFDGRRVENCLEARVGRIVLYWQVGDAAGSEAWACEDRNAVTRKDVPAGDAILWVEPECIGGKVVADKAAYEAPAPLAREIQRGQVVTLNTILIMVQAECGAGVPCLCEGATASLAPTEAHIAP
jgi:hypothetical protein